MVLQKYRCVRKGFSQQVIKIQQERNQTLELLDVYIEHVEDMSSNKTEHN